MLCTFCNTARLDNEAPCPHCGAPSPLLGGMNGGYGAAIPPPMQWGNTTSSLSNVQLNNQAAQVLPQTPQGEQQPWRTQGAPLLYTHDEQQHPASLLPVPYQAPQSFMTMQQDSMMNGNALMPMLVQNTGAMLPALPEEESAIYVPPMYTKPRAIIPRYRAIRGLLSVLIVAALLCSGAGYYVKASGKLTVLSQLYGLVPPPSLKAAQTPVLPDPQANPDFGPGYSIINSATTNSRIDPVSHASAQPANTFQTNQNIYLTYSVQKPKTPGVVTIKWYTNGSFYQSSKPIPVTTLAIDGLAVQQYSKPAEGIVELYWNDELAIRLYFVVR